MDKLLHCTADSPNVQQNNGNTAQIQTSINQLPDEILCGVLAYIHWRERFRLELVTKKWRNILTQKSMRKIDINLNSLVQDNPRLANAIESLVIHKSKIINGIVINQKIDHGSEECFKSALAMLITLGLYPLKRLNIQSFRQVNDMLKWNCFVQLVNFSINLEVLELRNSVNNQIEVDLSSLVNLKQLTGKWVKFINCRAPNLVKLKYSDVDVDDGDDFFQTLLVAADSIEEVCVRSVNIQNRLVNGQTITMPKLTKLQLSHTTNFNLTIDLAESKDLQRIITHGCDNDYGIINFNFAVQSYITYFHCRYNLSSEFIKSAKLYPERLCLLECLHICLSSSDEFNDFINCFSPSYNYCFRELKVTLKSESPLILIDYVNLVDLIKCSPDLRELNLPCSIDEQCLIDLILNKINCDYFEIYISSVSGCSEVKFLMDLYSALSGLDPRPTQSPDRSIITVNCNLGADHGDLTNIIRDEFGVNIE